MSSLSYQEIDHIYSLSLRVKKLCSENEDCDDNLKSLKTWFQNIGYPTSVIEREVNKVFETPRDSLFEEKHLICLEYFSKLSEISLQFVDVRYEQIYNRRPGSVQCLIPDRGSETFT